MQIVSRKSKHAIIAMIRLVELSKNGSHVRLCDISKRMSITESYLEKIFSKLVAAGLVTGLRGYKGGYVANDLNITMYQIIEAVSQQSSNDSNDDAIWNSLSDRVDNNFKNITLFDRTR